MNGTEIFTTEEIKKTQTITTLEIAEMMETEHWKILRKLEGDKKTSELSRFLLTTILW